ncbi:class I SAM-dependent methyltransferase [Metabacillus sp. RGM 3146]|uniref:class I SAM-dependent methyltransferase n=1 Tax=Metabacillus sp. RGM 3146 TaxID=3401092 RepID=UPI003B9990EB
MEKEHKWAEEAEKEWNQRAAYWSENSRDMWDKGSRKGIAPFFEKFVPKEGQILDIGCGDGYGSYKLHKKGYKVTGIDFSAEMIKMARKHEIENQLSFIQGDILELPFEDHFAQAMLVINCIEWVSNPLKALLELKRVLKPNGYLCIAILGPTAHPREKSFERLYNKPAVCHTMMPWEFEKLALHTGFTVAGQEGVYKRGVGGIMLENLSIELKQALSFMWLFMLKKEQ